MTKKIFSRIGFGTASLHHLANLKSKLTLLETAFDSGIRYFDTAPYYGHGDAERVLGIFVRNHDSDPALKIATKVGLVPNRIVSSFPRLLYPYIALRKFTTATHLVNSSKWQPDRDFSSSYIVKRVENSLRIMGLDCLDVVMLHEPTLGELNELEYLVDTVLSLKQRGLIKHFGISSQIDQAQWMLAKFPEVADVLQVELPSEITTSTQKWIVDNANITFGHFRMQSDSNANFSQHEKLQLVANNAVSINPSGTILFSSTKPSNIKSFVSVIEKADKNMQINHVY